MKFIETKIPGCFEIHPKILKDKRGRFIKTFHRDIFEKHGLETNWAEEYYTISEKRVLRGLHFQLPPHAHSKVVYCTFGEVMDAVVDLRNGSSTYGQFLTFDLTAENACMIYIPVGLAHGFYTLSEKATMIYKVSSVYTQNFDHGVHWSSANIPWPDSNPILSDRDCKFVKMDEFCSPFKQKSDN